jgi:hypothetical protein
MSRVTQCDRLLALLKAHEGYWVPLFRIMQLSIACHTKRIHELRKAGHNIEMQDHWIDRQRLVEYRLMPKVEEKGNLEVSG